MRYTVTFFMFITFLFSTSSAQDTGNFKIQERKILNSSSPATNQGTKVRIRCCRSSDLNAKPLFVVDGVPVEEFELKNLNPDNIESMCILKDNVAATLLRCNTGHGVVLITTKNANQRLIFIKDILTGERLPAANVDLISIERKDTIHLIADSLGRVVTHKIVYGKEYELKVSSVGYKTFRFFANSKQLGRNYTVQLERNYENLKNVTVKSFLLRPRTSIANFLDGQLRCLIAGVKTSRDQTAKEETITLSGIKLYPNPTQCFQKVNIEFKNREDAKLTLRLFSLDNKLVSSSEYQIKSGINRLSYSINGPLSAGIYFLQIVDKYNGLIKTERLVIQ